VLAAPTPGDADAPDHVIRRRPDPSTWSALEYTAHVADVLDHLGPAIRRITREDEPTITFFDNDERARQQAYNDMPRGEVLGWLDLACEDLAAILEATNAEDWVRVGHFDWGDRSALDMARNAVHEGSHHLRDAQRVLNQVRGRAI
jgi:DinB family protein